jgi:hypothetical protein
MLKYSIFVVQLNNWIQFFIIYVASQQLQGQLQTQQSDFRIIIIVWYKNKNNTIKSKVKQCSNNNNKENKLQM